MPESEESSRRPCLLVVETGPKAYREYLLRSLSTRYRVHLFCAAVPEWAAGYISGHSIVENPRDGLAMAAEALRLASREPVRGVMCWLEDMIVPAAQVARALGLPGGDPEAVARCCDKSRTRSALAVAGVPQPRMVAVTTQAEALRAADEVGYPAVLKPRGLAGSVGVVRVDGPDELSALFGVARDASAPGEVRYDIPVLVEEYVDGPEISVDAVVHQGRVQPMYIARKTLGYPPFFAEVGHWIDAVDPLLGDQALMEVLQRTHTALGLANGITHTEIRLTPRGPRVIEVNARLAGGLLPFLAQCATGVDVGLVAAAVACGRAPVLAPDRKLVAAIRFLHPERDGMTIRSIGFTRDRATPAENTAVIIAQPGQTVSTPFTDMLSGRIAYVTAVGADLGECQAALDSAQARLHVEAV
ncbi:ATP-grasp domain-containing protein [Nonomuraea sp. NPDC050643]|uniref:ATP-grasp domain-containing protein n=1 Tax=Nonomuraea sp. NPDC050643 TaxID=3155660 RepID=UPI0033D28C8C